MNRILRSLEIVVVDDHAPTRAVVGAMLRAAGAVSIREASDASEALALIAERGADLVITDHAMPGADGLSLIEALCSAPKDRRPRTLLMTGYTDVGPGKADAVLTKPLDAAALLRALNEALA